MIIIVYRTLYTKQFRWDDTSNITRKKSSKTKNKAYHMCINIRTNMASGGYQEQN